jgi:hypothetical protein
MTSEARRNANLWGLFFEIEGLITERFFNSNN